MTVELTPQGAHYADLTQVATPLGLLHPETELALMACDAVEAWSDNFGWVGLRQPGWDRNTVYRAAAEAALPPRPPSIDWAHVSPRFTVLATDRDGRTFLHEHRPRHDDRCWSDGGHFVEAAYFASFVRGTCDWRQSLLVRPAGPEAPGR